MALEENNRDMFKTGWPYPMPHESIETVRAFVKLSDQDDIPEFEYCLEELGELIQAIQKVKRARKRGTVEAEINAKKHLIEEIAHVYLTLNHIRDQEHISIYDIQKALDEKIEEWGYKNE